MAQQTRKFFSVRDQNLCQITKHNPKSKILTKLCRNGSIYRGTRKVLESLF